MTYQLECKKDGLRQTQDGLWKLTLTVHPNDMPDEILKAPMGAHYIAVFAEYDGGEPEPEQPKERGKFEDLPRSQQAGMLCQDKRFVAWCPGVTTPEEAAQYVRDYCGVTSRADLDTNLDAVEHWVLLLDTYHSQMGLRI